MQGSSWQWLGCCSSWGCLSGEELLLPYPGHPRAVGVGRLFVTRKRASCRFRRSWRTTTSWPWTARTRSEQSKDTPVHQHQTHAFSSHELCFSRVEEGSTSHYLALMMIQLPLLFLMIGWKMKRGQRKTSKDVQRSLSTSWPNPMPSSRLPCKVPHPTSPHTKNGCLACSWCSPMA